ncbi:hypothetical protein CXG81DRAFT_30218 [Caulochytrium protostelioides]|uniref:4-nitrophenylphosphatase n=1 Tax=Caulochytrium protostelioides TaxID=1555241 RepID=A0A4P9X304_9FUNG|nr:hypothetical protein CXG81DRAFT_30218 [Caulochytrium protostelioides]|eukprot:RKO99385.1 hypothetical protein CXG81DRAFT_30218 [Caulochytrium protostelioides]
MTDSPVGRLLDQYDTFLFDCDGVIWSGSAVIPQAREAIALLKKAGKDVCFVTNNSTSSRTQYHAKFARMGYTHVQPEDIFGSAFSAAYYLRHHTPLATSGLKVYVVGSQGITDELDAVGLPWKGAAREPAMNDEPAGMADLSQIGDDPEIGAVLMGFDLHINYVKLARAYTYLRTRREVAFYATNTDLQFPAANQTMYPGTGALISVLTTALDREPDAVLGKPSPHMLDVILESRHLDPKRTLMVGDRLDTDIAFGKHGGLGTLLVLSGVTSLDLVDQATGEARPDYIAPSIGHLVDALGQPEDSSASAS